MGLIFQILGEKLVAIRQMMFAARRLGGEGRCNSLRVSHLQRAVNLVSRNVVKPLALEFLRQRLPIQFCSLQQRQSTHHVGLGEGERVFDGAVNVALSGEVDDAVDLLVLHQLVERIKVADVHPDKLVVGLVLNVFEVGEIARIRQLIEVDDVVLGVLVHKQAHYVASNKACTTSNYNCTFHIAIFLMIS